MVVDDFGVKCSGKEHALKLKEALETKYKVTTDWEVKLYNGIALKWDYEKRTVQLSIPDYVRAALLAFQHKKPKRPQDSPYPWTQPVHGNNNQMLSEKAPYEEFDEHNQKRLHKIVVKFLYYARAIFPTMLLALNSLVVVQTKPKIETEKQTTQFLNCAWMCCAVI